LSTPDFDPCIAGFNNAPANTAQASTVYKTGYDPGKRDSMINTLDATSACRGFVSDVQRVSIGVSPHFKIHEHNLLEDQRNLRH
jgi:hypothetical protein